MSVTVAMIFEMAVSASSHVATGKVNYGWNNGRLVYRIHDAQFLLEFSMDLIITLAAIYRCIAFFKFIQFDNRVTDSLLLHCGIYTVEETVIIKIIGSLKFNSCAQ